MCARARHGGDGPQRFARSSHEALLAAARLTLYEGPARACSADPAGHAAAEAAGRRVGLLVPDDDAEVMAARLYAALRAFDAEGVDEIFARLPAPPAACRRRLRIDYDGPRPAASCGARSTGTQRSLKRARASSVITAS
jgi:hypothetical protein